MRKLKRIIVGLGVVGITTYILLPFTGLQYVLPQAVHQMTLLAGRVPVEEAIAQGRYTEKEIEALRRVPTIKAFGGEQGLASSENYDTINPDFHQIIWNVSACKPLQFKARKWWFPIVGSVPYLGFFDKAPADAEAVRLKQRGYDVYQRTAGAYSTLGWFKDPLLPKMLKWSEYSLANTLLHELAHATLWIPGSVQFNESFANFVGDVASMRYLESRYGPESKTVGQVIRRIEDKKTFRGILRQVYEELDQVYKNSERSNDEKLALKAAIFASIPLRVSNAPFHDPHRYQRAVRTGTWNNARMMQFRTYNRSTEWFQSIFDQEGGDFPKFFERIKNITHNKEDPFAALAEAAGTEL